MNAPRIHRFAVAATLAATLLSPPVARGWVRQNLRDQAGFSNHNLIQPTGRLRLSIERDMQIGAIRAAMDAINRSPGSAARIEEADGFDFPQGVASRGGFEIDGVNRVYSFHDDDPSFQAVALTAVFFEPTTGRILESDTAVNEAEYTLSTATPDDPNAVLGTHVVDLQEVVTHELLHAFGFDHSPIVGAFDPATGLEVSGWRSGDWTNQATMFPIATGTTSGRTLSEDDVAALATVYPDAKTQVNTIAGHVIDGATGRGLKGVHVVAVREEAPGLPVVGTISGTGETSDAGAFELSGLEPGSYYVRIEPLAGTSNPFTERSTQYRGFATSFEPEFYSGARESLVDVAIAASDAVAVTVGAGSRPAPIAIITNATPPPPVADVATFKDGKLVVRGDNFLTTAVAIEIDGRRIAGLAFPKKRIKPNGMATKCTSKGADVAEALAASSAPTLVVVETATGHRSQPIPVKLAP
jgi:hypothetical protein